jgi:phosphatidate cytidylyltransferase
MTRLLTAAFLIPAAWYLCKRAPYPVFLGAMLLVIAASAWEAFTMLAHRGARPFRIAGCLACLALGWAYAQLPPTWAPIDPLVAAAVIVPLMAMFRRDRPEAMFDAVQATLAPIVVVGLGLAHCVALRGIPGEDGPDLLLLALVCVTFADTGAYYVGSAFGKRRLAPTISPKKSWEGALGGLVFSIVGAFVGHLWFFQILPWIHAVVLGVLLAVAGMVGDLAESLMKRASGVKDSSGLLPGHGGVLDRVDSMIVAAPVLYYYWRIFLEGPIGR